MSRSKGWIVVWEKNIPSRKLTGISHLKGKAGKSSTSKVPNGNYRICVIVPSGSFNICAEPTQNLHFSEYVLKIKWLGLYEIWMFFFAKLKCCLISSPEANQKNTMFFFHTSLILATRARIPPLPSRSTFRICPNIERAEGAFFWT